MMGEGLSEAQLIQQERDRITKALWEKYEADPDYLLVNEPDRDDRFIRSPCDCDLFKIGKIYVTRKHDVYVGVAELVYAEIKPDGHHYRSCCVLKMIA